MTEIERMISDYHAELVISAAKNTIENYMRVLKAFAPFCGDDVPTREHAVAYIKSLKDKGNSANTIRGKYLVLRAFENWAVNTERVPHRFLSDIRLPRAEHTIAERLTLDETRELLSTTAPPYTKDATKVRDKAIIEMSIVTASRVSALCDLKLSDVDLENKTVRFTHTKNNKELEMGLTDHLCELLSEYIEKWRPKGNPDTGYLFVSTTPNKDGVYCRMSRQGIFSIVKRYTEKACDKPLSPHKLRHTSASIQLESGLLSIDEISANLGHSSISTTQRYAQRLDDSARRITTAELFNNLARG